MKEIGQRIAHVRRSRGESQQQIAMACGVSLRTWAALERGENVPSGDTLLRIASLGWNPGWILMGVGPEKVQPPSEAGSLQAGDELVPASPIDIQALAAVVGLVETWLVSNRRVLTPEKKGEIVAAIYQIVMEDAAAGEKQIDTRKVNQFLRLVS